MLLEAIEELRKRTTAGAATLLVKVKAHRGEPANEEANIQADKAISGKDVPTEWHDRTNRAVFTWQEPRWKGSTVSYEYRKSTWTSGVRKAIRRGSAEEEVHKHRDCVTEAWKQLILHVTSTRFCVYLLNIYNFTYTFSHAHTEAHTHTRTCTISTQEEWRQPGTGAWLRGAEERLC